MDLLVARRAGELWGNQEPPEEMFLLVPLQSAVAVEVEAVEKVVL